MCYRGIDPFEDTESSWHRRAIKLRWSGYRGIDPFEDTESCLFSPGAIAW